MKKRLLVLLCIMTLVFSAFVSCKAKNEDTDNAGNGDDTNTGEENQNSGTDPFYKQESLVGIIDAEQKVSATLQNKLFNALIQWDTRPEFATADATKYQHELVIGECDREVSKKAYLYLSRMEAEEHYSSYVIYSDGKSIAVAYDHESALEAAIDVLVEKYFVYETLTVQTGVYERETLSILDYYEAIDKAEKEEAFAALERKIGPEYGPAIVQALKEYYATLNPDVVKWFANLYDPDIGGYYFSNSGRNTPGYLPDLESTSQALGFFENMGVKAADVLPDEMKQKMGEFAYNMQNENGFFYHPQWSKELIDSKLSRRARDLGHAANLLSLAGMTPKYPLATDQIESTDPVSKIGLTDRLGGSAVVAVSKVVAVADVPHLANKEAFLTYLRGLGVYNNSYGPGNQISAQFSQIKAAGLADVCVDYFESIQNPKNGLWEDEVSYGAIDGLLKISGMWAQTHRVFPYAKEAIKSTIEVIMMDEPSGCVVEMYNCWYSIRNINDSMAYAKGSDGDAFVKETRDTLLALAPEALRLCQQKVAVCQKPDGSFSWSEKYSSATSQGVPVAVPNSVEGDINATVIGYSGTIGNFMHAIGYSKIPILGKRELYIYLDTLENLGSIVKEDTILIGEPFDFDGSSIGSAPGDFKISTGEGSSAVVAEDPVDSKNKVLNLKSVPDNGDILYIPNTVGMDGSCMVFTGDFYISSNTVPGYLLQITMDKCYLFTVQVDSEGKLKLIDANATTDSAAVYNTYDVTLDFDKWFNVKIEYYVGDKDTVRIKAYVNGTLVCVSDNYWDQSGNKFYGTVAPGTNAVETRIYCMQASQIDMYLDNLHTYKLNTTYTPEILNNPKAPNVDAPDKEEHIYDFDGDITEDVDYMESGVSDRLSDNIVVFDGQYEYNNGNKYNYSSAGVTASEFNGSKSLKIETTDKVAKLQIPTTVRTSTANCGTLGFDIMVEDAAVGDFATIKFYDKNTSANSSSILMGITLSCIEEGEQKYVVMKEMPGGVVSDQLDGVKIPLGNIVNMRFEFFHAEDATLIFIDDISKAASYAIHSGGHKYTLGYASIETNHKVPSTIQIDNLKCERIERSYAMATAPNVDRDVYHYDDKTGIETSGNVSVGANNGNNVLKVGNNGKVIIPINHRSPVVNITTLETLINFSAAASGAKTYIKLVDENMEEVFALALTGNGSSMVIRELTKNGETANVLGSFDVNSTYTLKLEVCPSKETANLYINGTAEYVTNVFFADEKLDEKPMYLVIESENSQFFVDDTYIEAVNTVFVQCKPTVGANKEDTATKYTFEYSSAVSLPKKLTKDLKSSGASIRIKSLLHDGAITNALAFTTATGGCDTLTFATMNTVPGATCATFEADLYFDKFAYGGKDDSVITQFNIGSAYMFHITVDKTNGDVKLCALTAGGGDGRVWGKGITLGAQRTWIHLRIDVFTGDFNSTLAKVYVDDELVLVTNNYKGYRKNTETPAAPSTDVSKAYFYTYSAGNGTIYLDNVSFDHNTTPKGNDEINDQRPAYVAPES